MTSLNPFLDDEYDAAHSNSTLSSSKAKPTNHSLDEIAQELLKNKYILTALEFYTEIQERGNDLHRLKNYFSNPSHFDLPVNYKDAFGGGSLCRTASNSTFDSLDMTRFSDEGGQVDEKIAVLEFELRKAKDTIKSLRANLTETAESQTSCLQETSPNGNGFNPSTDHMDQIKPLELRTINHLVNEYLLNHDYKLSSITFSDENEGQDFEDWDDVGINTAKPPDLLKLYRDYNNHVVPKLKTCDVSTMTEDVEIQDNNNEDLRKYRELTSALEEENLALKDKIDMLQRQVNDTTHKVEEKPLTKPYILDPPSSPPNLNCFGDSECEKAEKVEIHPDPQSSCEPCRMSKAMWEAMAVEMQSEIEESWLKDEVLNVAGSADELVLLLGRCLPHVVPTVLLAKRDQLVPLLLATAALHPDIDVRNQLLHILFNLIKKPDASQRLMFDYLKTEMRGSLLISILLQMEQEEKVEAVRCSLVKSFASIYAFVEDDDKYAQSFQLLSTFLDDNNASVRDAACLHLLPSVAVWATRRGVLHAHMCDELLKKLERAVSEKKSDSAISEALPVAYLLPYLLVASLLEINVSDDGKQLPDKRSVTEFRRELEDPAFIIGDESILSEKLQALDSIVTHSVINNEAKVLLWTTNFFIPRVLNMLASLSPDFTEGVRSLAELMDIFCKLFGKCYIKEKVLQLFENVLKNSLEHLSTCIVPVYVASLLPLLEDGWNLIHDFLSESIIKLSTSQFSTDNIKLTLVLLRCKPHYHDLIIQTLWSVVMHESALVRSTAASLFVVMTTNNVDAKILSSRVLPALITLSTDDKTNVRIGTLSSFCYVMINPNIDFELVDRVITQFTEVMASSVESSFEEQSQDGTLLGLFSVQSTLCGLVARLGAVFHPKFRDKFVLPHLVAIAISNNQSGDSSKRSLISLNLLDAYTCLSCCFITSTLLLGSVLPGLKYVLHDVEALHPKKVNDVTNLISEVERKLEQGAIASESHSSEVFVASPLPPASANPLSHALQAGATDTKKKLMSTLGQLRRRTPSGSSILSWKN